MMLAEDSRELACRKMARVAGRHGGGELRGLSKVSP